MLVGVREEFRKQFGREMRADDPLFWDPDLSEPTPISVEKIEAVTVDAMRIAGYPPAHIYAYQETGMLVSEENIDLFPDEDIDEYMAAMARYEALHA